VVADPLPVPPPGQAHGGIGGRDVSAETSRVAPSGPVGRSAVSGFMGLIRGFAIRAFGVGGPDAGSGFMGLIRDFAIRAFGTGGSDAGSGFMGLIRGFAIRAFGADGADAGSGFMGLIRGFAIRAFGAGGPDAGSGFMGLIRFFSKHASGWQGRLGAWLDFSRWAVRSWERGDGDGTVGAAMAAMDAPDVTEVSYLNLHRCALPAPCKPAWEDAGTRHGAARHPRGSARSTLDAAGWWTRPPAPVERQPGRSDGT
jgi:hypothetical protein